LINGRATIMEINHFFGKTLIEENIGQYATISGFMIQHLKSMPHAGDVVRVDDLKFEILDMDGVRIDKIAVSDMTLAKQ
jgi:putative hemolysin